MKQLLRKINIALSVCALLFMSVGAIVCLSDRAEAQYTTNGPGTLTIPTSGFVQPPVQFGNFYGGYFTNSNAGIGTNGNAAFKNVATTQSITAGTFLSANTVFVGTNGWPASPTALGGSALWNSNSTVYLLTSLPGASTWAATNKLAP